MKRFLLLTTLTGFLFLHTENLIAQEVTPQMYIKEATDYLNAGNYKEAITSLQSAIGGINNLLMTKVVATLPAEINGYKYDENDNSSSNAASLGILGGGMTIERTYRKPDSEDSYIELSILGNSPMLSSINMLLTNPMYMTSSGSKELRFGTRKGVLKKEGGDFEFMMPLTSSMITIKGNGIASEADFIAILNKINFETIAKALGE